MTIDEYNNAVCLLEVGDMVKITYIESYYYPPFETYQQGLVQEDEEGRYIYFGAGVKVVPLNIHIDPHLYIAEDWYRSFKSIEIVGTWVKQGITS